jgi:hypothetical protein
MRDFRMPTRLVTDSHGYARPPRSGDSYDVIFVRDDGWSLAAPEQFRDVARRLWERDWVRTIECPRTVVA